MNDDDAVDDQDDIVRLDFVYALSLLTDDVQTLNAKMRPDPMDGGGIGGGGPGGGGGAVPLLNNTPVTQRAISIVSMLQTPNAILSFEKKDIKLAFFIGFYMLNVGTVKSYCIVNVHM